MASKQVRFFTPVLVDEHDQRQDFTNSFWSDVQREIAALSEPQRSLRFGGAPYYGEEGSGFSRAYSFIRVGRVRERADWPDTLDTNFTVAPLNLGNRKLYEAGYLVPFGTVNKVAYMGPMRGIVSMRAIEYWLGAVLDLPRHGQSIELVPEVDPGLLRKIAEADGVSKLSVRVPHDVELDLPEGRKSAVERAIENAVNTAEDQVDVGLTFSYGRRTPVGSMRQELLHAVRRLARAEGPDKIEMSLILPDGDTFKTEHHELVKDTIAITVRWHVADDHQITIDEAMEQIHRAIKQFRAL